MGEKGTHKFRSIRSPELELQVVVSCPVWVLGTELKSTEEQYRALNQGAVSPALTRC